MKKRPLDVDFGKDEILAKLNLLLHRSQVYQADQFYEQISYSLYKDLHNKFRSLPRFIFFQKGMDRFWHPG